MFYTGLARVARDAGLTVREVPDWETRTAHSGGMEDFRGVIWHHTATPAAAVKARNNPTLQYMVDGLRDKNGNPYPLCNYAMAWDGSLDVVAAGTGAHAGEGVYQGIPRNNGNRYLAGVEVEGTIGLTWSDGQLEAAARLGHQLNKEFGEDLLHIAHYEWAPGRKTDPTGIPGGMPALRAAIKRGYWKQATINPAATTEEDTLSAEDVNRLEDAIKGLPARIMGYEIAFVRGSGLKAIDVENVFKNLDSGMNAAYGLGLENTGRIAALENAITQLAAATGNPIDLSQVKAASYEGTKKAIEDSAQVEGTLQFIPKEDGK